MLASHDVTTVASARDALTRIEGGERYDAILTDVMMPDMSGMELYAQLARVVPEEVGKMVFMTGGAFTDQARAFFERVANPTLEKPFDKATLVAVLEHLLA